MKHLYGFFLFILFISCLPANAQQNWIPEGDYRIYGPGLGVQLSFRQQVGSRLVYGNYVQLKKEGATVVNGEFYNLDHYSWDEATWCGQVSYDAATDTIYLFRGAYPFKCHPGVGEEWVLLRLPHEVQVRAKVTSITPGDSLPINDTLTTIELSSYDSSGNPVTTDYSGKKIQVGRIMGLYAFPSILSGSGYDAVLTRSKVLAIGAVPLAIADIFNFKAGDEIHTWTVKVPPDLTEGNTKSGILQVQVAGSLLITTDSIYTGGFGTMRYGPDSGLTVLPMTAVLRKDTVNLDDFAYLSRRQSEACLDSSQNYNFYLTFSETSWRNNLRNVTRSDDFYRDRGLPFQQPYYRGTCTVFDEYCEQQLFYAGLGGPYLMKSGLGGYTTSDPVYYKNASGTWGTPITYSMLMAVQPVSGMDCNVYPNPAGSLLNISWPGTSAAAVKVFNTHGQLVLETTVNAGHNTINTSTLAIGVYWYMIDDGSNLVKGKVVISGR